MEIIEIDLSPTIGNLRFQTTLHCVQETIKNIMKHDELFIAFQKPNDLDFISTELEEIISKCLKFAICLEGNEDYRNICDEFKNNFDSDQYFLKPCEKMRRVLHRDIKEFIFLYSNRKTDTELDIEIKKHMLENTFNLIEAHINDLYSSTDYYKYYSDNDIVLKKHMKILSAFKERITGSHQKLNTFLNTITSANANYITPFFRIQPYEFRNKYIYPIVYDLIYNRFATMLKVLTYRKELTSVKYFSNTIEDLKTEQTYSYDNRFAHMSDLHLLINHIPDEFNFHNKLSDETNYLQNTQEIVTKVILLHYSEVFNVNYANMLSLIKQIENYTTAHNEPQYRLKKIEKNLKLNVEENFFRTLSLYVH